MPARCAPHEPIGVWCELRQQAHGMAAHDTVMAVQGPAQGGEANRRLQPVD